MVNLKVNFELYQAAEQRHITISQYYIIKT
jgi:hypothetical protein